jgi:hypothetical protein
MPGSEINLGECLERSSARRVIKLRKGLGIYDDHGLKAWEQVIEFGYEGLVAKDAA